MDKHISSDPAVNPNHYKCNKGFEAIDVIEAFTDGLNGIQAADTANVIKYILRWHKKNGLQDLEKARWYLDHLIERVRMNETIDEAFADKPLRIYHPDCGRSEREKELIDEQEPRHIPVDPEGTKYYK